LKVLLDEMYPAALAQALRVAGIDACTAFELGVAGRSDIDVFAAAVAEGCAVLTENVADFARISADQLIAGRHHPGLLIALSSRFSRRPAGMRALVAAVRELAGEQLDDRVVYLHTAALPRR
jgi:hypothetical protein